MLSRTRGVGAVSLKVAFDAFALWKIATPRSSIALRLPVELLQNVFLFLARLYLLDGDHYPSSRPDWFAVTHVCRYWRSAALGLHELWSSITPGLSLSWSQAMMERSTPLPVHVDIRISTSSTDGLHPLAASELLFAASRIRTLRLIGLRVDILRVLDRLCSPSPLEALDLSIVDSGSLVELPETLFGGKAPHLRCLTFAADTCVRAPLWLLRGVAEFTTGADVSLPELLDALREMPRLEVLRVQHCRAVWEEAEGPGPAPRVALSRLKLISFRDTTPRRFVLLSLRIDAPSTVRRHLSWRSWAVSSWERWTGLLAAMRGLVPRDSVAGGGDDGDLRVVRVTGGPSRGSFCTWTRSASAPATPASQDDALFLFQIDWVRSPVDPHSESLLEHSSPFFHLASLCAELRATRVQELSIEPDVEHVTDDVGMPMMHWQSLVGALPSVQSLRLRRGTASLLSIISAHSLLPNLQKLYIVQCTVGYTAERLDGVVLWNLKRLALRGSPGPGPGPATRDVANMGEELVALVRSRYGLEVILIGCSVDAGALEALRKRAQLGVGDEWVYV
ncbi:hypothetical protein BJV78DRAFT_1282017 [Lactifluus subvellereus]|nr:hypothetical protein BJV78DRAFT_1282017 [Lactifluus subvellereus]